MKDFEVAIQWLLDCGLITKVCKVTSPSVPLASYVDYSSFKLFTVDIGLLGAMSDLDAVSILEGNDIFREFKGALTEQYVLQQIVSDTSYTPFYYGTDSATFENDFTIQKGKNIVPIEVKAEVSQQSKSLKVYCDKFHPAYAVRISMKDYRQEERMTNIPLYAVCNM